MIPFPIIHITGKAIATFRYIHLLAMALLQAFHPKTFIGTPIVVIVNAFPLHHMVCMPKCCRVIER